MATTTLSTVYKASNVSLSGGNLVATASSTDGNTSSRSNDPAYITDLNTNNKLYYFEAVLGATANDQMVGIANAFLETNLYLGNTNNGVGLNQPTGLIYKNGSTTASGLAAMAANDVVQVAFNKTKIWWRYNGGQWMGNNASNDPAAGTGGYTHGLTGYLFAAYRVGISGTSLTFRFSSGSWTGTPPSGAVEMVSPPNWLTTGAWNTDDTGGGITFSSSNKVATRSGSGETQVRAVAARVDLTTGLYCEFETASNLTTWVVGLSYYGNVMSGSSSRPAIAHFDDNFANPRVVTNSSGSNNPGFTQINTSGQIIQLAAKGTKVWFRVNNSGNWNATSGHDPATNTGGYTISPAGNPLFPAAMLFSNNEAIRLRALASEWIHAPPTGFLDVYGNAVGSRPAGRRVLWV